MISQSKWPKEREQLLFDVRDEDLKEFHKRGVAKNTFNADNMLWGGLASHPQLKFEIKVSNQLT